MCERKKKEENERWERKAEEATRESEVWEIINKERKRRRINEGIGMSEWREQFMRVLGGVEERVVRGNGREMGEEDREEISREEIRRIRINIKEGKAVGLDGIPGEVWKHGGEELEEWVRGYYNRIWKGEGWPQDWREGVIVPILKKGGGEKAEYYRGVTLMSTLYKIYATVLAERLREEVESKGIIPPNQTGFRKGIGTIDNIYVLNMLINSQINRKGEKWWHCSLI